MLSRIVAIGVVALAAISVTAPNVAARNPARYTNLPFLVAASCPSNNPSASSKLVSSNGSFNVVLNTDDDENAGFEYYCSAPGTGTLANSPAGTYPQGILTFNITGIPSGGYIEYSVVYSAGANVYASASSLSGPITIPANQASVAGATVQAIQVYPSSSSGNMSTVTISNIRYNNVPVNFDTTVTDQGDATFDFCGNRP